MPYFSGMNILSGEWTAGDDRSGDDGDCQRFWEIWTAKEALFKLTGKGPLLALSRFSLPAGVTLDYTAQKGCALTIAAQIL